MNINILEDAAGQVAWNLFKMKYPDVDVEQLEKSDKRLQECINDSIFVINNFMRISADLAEAESRAAVSDGTVESFEE